MMNSFSFTLSGKHFIYPFILNDSFAGYSNLGFRSLLFITLSIFLPIFTGLPSFFWEISWQSYGSSLVGNYGNCFSLAAFNIFSLTFGILIGVSWCGPLWVHLVWNSMNFPDLYVYFFHQVEGVSCHYFFKWVFNFLLSLFSFWHPRDVNGGMLEVVLESPYIVLNFLDSFSVLFVHLFCFVRFNCW